jgi:benzoyl-CoA reductase/2-hydroxyglutaryl-CoA dehydratase subunit BcrC/BadD/HgdB
MLPDEFTSALSSLLEHPPHGEPGDAVPVVLSGTTFDNIELARAIESAGFWIAGEDLSTGSRWWSMEVVSPARPDDAWRALAHAYLRRPPCSVKEPSAPRADHLVAQVRDTGARGVIFYLTRFCESEQVEWPYLRDRLAAERVPVLLLEGDHRSSGFAGVRTRLEAFREQLEDSEVA